MIILLFGVSYSMVLLYKYWINPLDDPNTEFKDTTSSLWNLIINNFYIFFATTVVTPFFLILINYFYLKWFKYDTVVIMYFLGLFILFTIKKISKFSFELIYPLKIILLLPLWWVIWDLKSERLIQSIALISIIFVALSIIADLDSIKKYKVFNLIIVILFILLSFEPYLYLFIPFIIICTNNKFKIKYLYNFKFIAYNILLVLFLYVYISILYDFWIFFLIPLIYIIIIFLLTLNDQFLNLLRTRNLFKIVIILWLFFIPYLVHIFDIGYWKYYF